MPSQFQILESQVNGLHRISLGIARSSGSLGLESLYEDACSLVKYSVEIQEDLMKHPHAYQQQLFPRLWGAAIPSF